MIVIEAEIDEQGRLVIQLPPDSPRGRVEVVIREIKPVDDTPLTDKEIADLLSEESLKGYGLSAAEIANSPEFGIWADRAD